MYKPVLLKKGDRKVLLGLRMRLEQHIALLDAESAKIRFELAMVADQIIHEQRRKTTEPEATGFQSSGQGEGGQPESQGLGGRPDVAGLHDRPGEQGELVL
jgi:hypothetical protein